MSRMADARTLSLAGYFEVVHEEGVSKGDIDHARRIDYPNGTTSFLIEYKDPDERWELRLSSPRGRTFTGAMKSSEWEHDYQVVMELWRRPDDEREWLLRGYWLEPDEGEVQWAMVLFVEDGE